MSTGLTLALEWSSRRLSVAWRDADGPVREKVAQVTRFRISDALNLLEELGPELPRIREIRIGRGPGNYTGVRQALAWSIGIAAPGGMQLRTVDSGRAQARRLRNENGNTPFTLLGDARRQLWWGQTFPSEECHWTLHSPQHWIEQLKDKAVLSPDPERLTGLNAELDEPRATDVLDLPDSEFGEELSPCYLHPAVS